MTEVARVLGIDFGERRIGIALSDPTRTIAQPHATLVRRRRKRPPVAKILHIMVTEDIDTVVLGLPLSLDGDEPEWAAQVRDFGDSIARRSGRPVEYVDERFSSVLAERAVRSLGLPRAERERKERIDAAAAAIILQTYLDRAKESN